MSTVLEGLKYGEDMMCFKEDEKKGRNENSLK
jgi:hypothetical protein